MPDFAVLTSWPTGLKQGSGTALFTGSLLAALRQENRSVELIGLDVTEPDYQRLLSARLRYNTTLLRNAARLSTADCVLGLDYDGFTYTALPGQRFVCSARALFADIAPTEPEPCRSLLELQACLEAKNMHKADLVTTPSEYAKRKLIDYHDIDAGKIHVIPNAIDLKEWTRLLEDAVAVQQNDHPILLAVSKLYPRKKIDVLLRAMPKLIKRYPDIELRVAGGGIDCHKLRALATQLGIATHVTWLGDVDRRQVAVEFKRCHLFVHSSIQETFGNVCLESMASGRPLIVSDAASLPEIIDNSGAGKIVPPGDSLALEEMIDRLLSVVTIRTTLAEQGRRYSEQWDWRQVARRYIRLAHC